MAHFPGLSPNPKGRPPGVPNKATGRAREVIADFVDDNAHRLVEWLDRIAEENPKAAFDSFMSVVEYHIPKLSRAENINKTVGIVQIVLEAAKQQGVVIDAKAENLPVQQQSDDVSYPPSRGAVDSTPSESVSVIQSTESIDNP